MRFRRIGWLAALGLVAMVVLPHGAAAKSGSLQGKWLTEDRKGVIEIGPCGAVLCGRIVGMAEFAADGSIPKDVHGRPECGLEIIHGLVQDAAGEWNGTITNPENGSLYGARLSLQQDGQLRLRGFLRMPLMGSALGSTQVWTEYAGTLTADCRMPAGANTAP